MHVTSDRQEITNTSFTMHKECYTKTIAICQCTLSPRMLPSGTASGTDVGTGSGVTDAVLKPTRRKLSKY